MNNKVYNLSFTKILDEINNYEIGTIIESQSGDRYKLSIIGTSNKKRKFSRMKCEGTKLRFMTYNNSKRMFRIVKNDEEIDIDNIEEVNHYDVISAIEGRTEDNINTELGAYSLAINELIKAVKQINNKLKEKEYCECCGVELTEKNRALRNMCNECKYGLGRD